MAIGRGERLGHLLCGVGGCSPPSALLELHLQPLPQPRGKHAWLFSTAPHIMPRGWGASANGGPLNPAPGCPSHPFSLAAANSATARGNISTTACAPFARQPARPRFACALFLPRSLRNCRPLGGWGAPRTPAPLARAACSRFAPCAALAPPSPGASRPRFQLAFIASQSGAVSPPYPSHLPLSGWLSPASVRESLFF